MYIQRCTITLHEPLFFATREIGRLYETGRYLHNYALTYALGLTQSPWFHAEQVPHYAEDLTPLRDQHYVTPAEPKQVTFQLATFKYGEEELHVEMEQATRNTPSFGRAKELAPESTFRCFVLSAAPLKLPRWIRLGKWHSKALVETEAIEVKQRSGEYTAASPLNPLDVPAGVLRAFDIISMPPSSLVANARCHGDYYEIERGIGLPVGLRYTFPS
ncbi:MAG: type I-D CRISPR-associated protein Cas5/Csc1 [bacterium]|nr:type I-D CRISPR-associated protein Cas5/Csc1 [bacterium]